MLLFIVVYRNLILAMLVMSKNPTTVHYKVLNIILNVWQPLSKLNVLNNAKKMYMASLDW